MSTLIAAFLGAMAGTTLFIWLAAWYLHRIFKKDRDIEKVQIIVVRTDL